MNILMISGDKSILDEQSEAHERMRAYAGVCDELHIVVLTNQDSTVRVYGNLFLYHACGRGKIIQRMRAMSMARMATKRHMIDIVSAQSPDEMGCIAFVISRLFRIPLQLQVHTDMLSPWYRRAGIMPRIRYYLARFLLPRAQCIRVVSRRIRDSLADTLGISSSLMTVLPIFTNVQKFTVPHSGGIDNAKLRSAQFKIIAVGRFLDREKNFSMLIRAMTGVIKMCPSAILMLVGDGPDKEYYVSLIHLYGLENHIIVEPWRTDLDMLYPSFDVFALPSYIEGWGRAVIEAMASGLAVVMTDVGLAGEVVHEGINGYVVPVADSAKFTVRLIDLWQNPEKRQAFGRMAKETAVHLEPRTEGEYLIQWRKSFTCCFLRQIV